MTEVWFIRHGESKSNAGEVVPNRHSAPLTEKGLEQAKETSSLFINKKPDLIVTSSYARAQQTAEPVIKIYPDVPCEVWPLHEIKHISDAHYNNTTKHERKSKTLEYWERMDPELIHGEGSESFVQFIERIKYSFDRLLGRDEKFIAVFTHGLVMQGMRAVLNGGANDDYKCLMEQTRRFHREDPLPNCHILKAKAKKDGILLF